MSEKKEALQRHIEDLERVLAELKARLHDVEEEEQHEAIEHLEDYLGSIDHKWDNLRSYWPVLLSDLRHLFDGKKSS